MPDGDLPKPDRRSQNEEFDDQFLRRYLLGQCSQIESDVLEQAVLLNGEIADLLSATEDELTEEYVENTLSETDLQCFKQRFLATRARRDKIALTAKLLDRTREELAEAFELLVRVSIRQKFSAGREPEESTSSEKDEDELLGGTESFDETYVQRLCAGDVRTQEHFVADMGNLVKQMLRSRLHSPQAIEDARQETFARVFSALRSGKSRQRDLVALVISTCSNVWYEKHYRARIEKLKNYPDQRQASSCNAIAKKQLVVTLRVILEEMPEQDRRLLREVLLEERIAKKQMVETIREILQKMPAQDRRLLRKVFLEQRDKNAVCKDFGVDFFECLWALLYSAKHSFETLYLKKGFKQARRA